MKCCSIASHHQTIYTVKCCSIASHHQPSTRGKSLWPRMPCLVMQSMCERPDSERLNTTHTDNAEFSPVLNDLIHQLPLVHLHFHWNTQWYLLHQHPVISTKTQNGISFINTLSFPLKHRIVSQIISTKTQNDISLVISTKTQNDISLVISTKTQYYC